MVNLFVDEARLNGNAFSSKTTESRSLINNYDTHLAETANIAGGQGGMVELYLF
jgi:hypothetical protein